MAQPISLQDAAYAAGFFDGEGCILIAYQSRTISRGKIYPGGRYFLNVCMSQNDPAPIEWLVKKFGGAARIVRGKRSYDQGRYERWDWKITTDAALRFLKTVRPFLIVKAEQADIAFEFAETVVRNRRKTPAEVQEKRAEMYARMKEAKHAFKISSAG